MNSCLTQLLVQDRPPTRSVALRLAARCSGTRIAFNVHATMATTPAALPLAFCSGSCKTRSSACSTFSTKVRCKDSAGSLEVQDPTDNPAATNPGNVFAVVTTVASLAFDSSLTLLTMCVGSTSRLSRSAFKKMSMLLVQESDDPQLHIIGNQQDTFVEDCGDDWPCPLLQFRASPKIADMRAEPCAQTLPSRTVSSARAR
mmetsp:Transcript_425/g.847  ORF Transcript_425/g.847 Transcript_425/m.847 type:complete len:201 (+) Transcript_425:858-1460(+)